MSSMETHIGKLQRFIRDPDETDVQYVKRFLRYKSIKFKDTDGSEEVFEVFYDEMYKLAVWYKSYIYEVIEDFKTSGQDIFHAVENKAKNEIDFTVQYYNGGCCFDEAIGKALSKILD